MKFISFGMLNLSADLRLHRTTDINNIWTHVIKFGYINHSPEHTKTSASTSKAKSYDICTFCIPNKEQYKFINGSGSKFGQAATNSFVSYKNIFLPTLI